METGGQQECLLQLGLLQNNPVMGIDMRTQSNGKGFWCHHCHPLILSVRPICTPVVMYGEYRPCRCDHQRSPWTRLPLAIICTFLSDYYQDKWRIACFIYCHGVENLSMVSDSPFHLQVAVFWQFNHFLWITWWSKNSCDMIFMPNLISGPKRQQQSLRGPGITWPPICPYGSKWPII